MVGVESNFDLHADGRYRIWIFGGFMARIYTFFHDPDRRFLLYGHFVFEPQAKKYASRFPMLALYGFRRGYGIFRRIARQSYFAS